MAGCVYAMEVPERRKIRTLGRHRIHRRLIKIGHVIRPENLKSRRANLSYQYRTEFIGLYAVELRGYLDAENSLHGEFASRNVSVDNRLDGESREFFDLRPEEAISALKRIPNARLVKPQIPWAIRGSAGQRFEGEPWVDSIVIYVRGGYDVRKKLYDDDVWFGHDIPYLRMQERSTDDFEPVATVTLSGGWNFLPEDPDSNFPFWGIVGPDGDPCNANQAFHNEIGRGVTVVYTGRGRQPSPR